MNTRFHLAFPVKDLDQTKIFYLNILGCSLGRESLKWVDFNLFGHQIVAHLSPEDCGSINRNQVDGDKIPARHFGVILNWDIWENLIKSIKEKDIVFYIKPKIRFKNKKGEQGTFFILDPSENVLEFKSFKNDSMVFER
ncbi:MAG: glyoxalase [Candidatus Marinimicrobia bacterium]|nr:glyoxalase [Candidatus Neomarinimicrobiota bacterium]